MWVPKVVPLFRYNFTKIRNIPIAGSSFLIFFRLSLRPCHNSEMRGWNHFKNSVKTVQSVYFLAFKRGSPKWSQFSDITLQKSILTTLSRGLKTQNRGKILNKKIIISSYCGMIWSWYFPVLLYTWVVRSEKISAQWVFYSPRYKIIDIFSS